MDYAVMEVNNLIRYKTQKIDVVGPVDNRPSTNKLKKNNTWHVTRYRWHMTHGGGWTFSQNFSFPALMVWDGQCLEDSEQKDDRLNESMNEWIKVEGVYRTALAAPELLRNIYVLLAFFFP